ncbi:hypothetical protein A2U01_0052934, partial [Trifolium medium]|nr:hypothetical protein [Trifolium medium]
QQKQERFLPDFTEQRPYEMRPRAADVFRRIVHSKSIPEAASTCI